MLFSGYVRRRHLGELILHLLKNTAPLTTVLHLCLARTLP